MERRTTMNRPSSAAISVMIVTLFVLVVGVSTDLQHPADQNLIRYKAELMDRVKSRVDKGLSPSAEQYKKAGLPIQNINGLQNSKFAPMFKPVIGGAQPGIVNPVAGAAPAGGVMVVPGENQIQLKKLPSINSPGGVTHGGREPINLPAPARKGDRIKVPGIPISVEDIAAAEKQRKAQKEDEDDEDEDLKQVPLDGNRAQGESLKFEKSKPVKISEYPACSAVIGSICRTHTSNFAVLDCLQNAPQEVVIPKDCQHFVWQYKRNLTTDERFDSAAVEVCRRPLKKLKECNRLSRGSGHLISCLIGHKLNISDANCKQFLNKMGGIIFSDYRLMSRFADACSTDIMAHSCGRLPDDEDESSTSQGKTIRCLSEHIGSLNRDCKHEILRVAELQSDDFHQDRQLFFACRDDRERFCPNVAAGSGKVFKCLFKHKFEQDMTTECRKMLTLRQQLIQLDYKVSRTFVDACRKDIKHNSCIEGTQGAPHAVKMSLIILCLESAHKAKGSQVTPECLAEMTDFRRSLMEDYRINPGIVSYCNKEISEHCGGGLEREGRTLHCLMDLARPMRKPGNNVVKFSPLISPECLRELKLVIREADIGEDYRLDRALQDACQPVVEVACRNVIPGGARVLSCLMSHMESNKMTDECEERLMEVQYFISRDFRLSPNLYHRCALQAKSLCLVKGWAPPKLIKFMNTDHLYIFSCLYRRMKERKLDRSCSIEVRRVMRERAINVDLEPRIEEPCMQDLAKLCSDEVEKGKEVSCLQDNLDDLDKRCRWAVGNYTEDQDEDPQLDRILIKACTPMIKEFCEDAINKQTEPEDVMECLIKYVYNPRMDAKCSAGINHHMLLTMKDFRFSYRFKESCKKDVLKNCKGMKEKADVVFCLSERVHNDTLLDDDHRVSLVCRKQLRFEKFQMASNINLDKRLRNACETDIIKRCRMAPGKAKVIECLKKSRSELTSRCHRMVFKREKEEAEDNSIDFTLQSNCREEIKEFCSDEDPKDVMNCLKKHKGAVNFDSKCRKVVLGRQAIQNTDYRMNPRLRKSCKLDIPKFCLAILSTQKNDEHLEGKVINCLKIKYRQNRLSDTCEETIQTIIKEAAMDYKQDPVLAKACVYEIKHLCTDPNLSEDDETRGKVEECLKLKFKQKLVQNKDCQREVLRIIAEGKADIYVDPLLHKSCALDLKHYCFKVPPGEGRQMSCLLAALDDRTIRLSAECHKMLSDRVEMWEYAAKVAPPETMHELVAQITMSPNKNYFMGVIFVVVGLIFIGGLFCGRVTKKIRAENKNK